MATKKTRAKSKKSKAKKTTKKKAPKKKPVKKKPAKKKPVKKKPAKKKPAKKKPAKKKPAKKKPAKKKPAKKKPAPKATAKSAAKKAAPKKKPAQKKAAKSKAKPARKRSVPEIPADVKFTIDAKVQRQKDVAWRMIEGEAVIITPADSTMHTLNDVGTRIWELITGERSLRDVAKVLCAEFEVDKERAEKDTIWFAECLAKKGLVENR